MAAEKVKINSIKAWFLAARPKTLTGAAVPVMIALALAYRDIGAEKFLFVPALLCVLFAFIMQMVGDMLIARSVLSEYHHAHVGDGYQLYPVHDFLKG